MKIAFNFRIIDGPWGGGNRFVRGLAAALTEAGHRVVHDLAHPDIDFILLLDPRRRHPAVTFTPAAAWWYTQRVNSHALVVHRINECDERKGTTGMNRRLKRANGVADHTVFVGEWLRGLDLWQGGGEDRWTVVRNGADPKVFHPRGLRPWRGEGPLRLVTHHWGGNWFKGFDVYGRLDEMMEEPAWRGRVAFTYVGNLPPGFRFRNARYVDPLDGEALASELRRHHVYLTASINEPGGNHQNEGALCGQPLLYRNSGCLPEYCAGFGLMFDGPQDFPAVLERFLDLDTYARFQGVMHEYPYVLARTCADWLALMERLDARRDAVLSQRRARARAACAAASLWPF